MITERWTGKGWRISSGRLEAERVFDVDGVTAESAVPLLGITINSGHPHNSSLKCADVSVVESPGPFYHRVRAFYTFPPGGGFIAPDNPLLQPIRIRWERGGKSIQIDRDLSATKVPIVNSANQPFLPHPERYIVTRFLSVTRFEPFYDLAKSVLFENKVNTNTFSVGPLSIAKGQCLCHCIEPTTEYPNSAFEYIEISYKFEIDTSREEPFQLWLIDQGTTGYYAGPNVGNIVAPNGNTISGEVLLDSTGKPVNTSLRIDEVAVAAPIANPNRHTYYKTEHNGQAWSLGFKIREDIDFTGLGFGG